MMILKGYTYLHVLKKQNVSNAAVLGICAWHFLYIAHCLSCIKYWLKTLDVQENRLNKTVILCYLKMTLEK